MKLYKLKGGQRFIIKFYNAHTDTIEVVGRGTFVKLDGMYCQVILDGCEEVSYFIGSTEVDTVDITLNLIIWSDNDK
jgi:hypothetical protein